MVAEQYFAGSKGGRRREREREREETGVASERGYQCTDPCVQSQASGPRGTAQRRCD